jgi:hypothetical protein
MTEHRQRFSQTRKLVKGRAHLGGDFSRFGGRAKQLFTLLEMAIAQRFHTAQGANEMAFRRLLSDRQQRVRRTAECGDYNRRLTVETAFDDRSGTLDRFCITD